MKGLEQPRLALIHSVSLPKKISLAEKRQDHEAIVQGYLDTHYTRNHSENTIRAEKYLLAGWFDNETVEDPTHSEGQRELFVWEAMQPVLGRERFQRHAKNLRDDGLEGSTMRSTMGKFRRLFDYILEFPTIPGSGGVSIAHKYGRIEQPITAYEYPVHAVDRDSSCPILYGASLLEFLDFVRTVYLPACRKSVAAQRDYTMIIVDVESGLRIDELIHLDGQGRHRDICYAEGFIQTRFGKGTKGSGKRTRQTILSPLARQALQVYEKEIRPQFKNSAHCEALFLSETGTRISYDAARRNLGEIAEAARKAGIVLPAKFGWHDFRRAFATNFMKQKPDQIWLLMQLLGHLHPGSLHRYVKFGAEDMRSRRDSVIESLSGSGGIFPKS